MVVHRHNAFSEQRSHLLAGWPPSSGYLCLTFFTSSNSSLGAAWVLSFLKNVLDGPWQERQESQTERDRGDRERERERERKRDRERERERDREGTERERERERDMETEREREREREKRERERERERERREESYMKKSFEKGRVWKGH